MNGLLLAQASLDLHHMENWFDYTPTQFQIVTHVLTLGFGAFAGAIVYFLLQVKKADPRFRTASILSCVICASAFLILGNQAIQWQRSFALIPELGLYRRIPEMLYSNGFRYMNWGLNVPLLAIALLIVLPLNGSTRRGNAMGQVATAGVSMVICSWVGSFFEQGNHAANVNITGWYVSNALGWVFFAWVLWVIFRAVSEGIRNAPADVARLLKIIMGLVVVTWTLYGVILAQPILWWSAESSVVRQALFTLTDITSKAIYAVLLGQVAIKLSAHDPAPDVYGRAPVDQPDGPTAGPSRGLSPAAS